ncbi:hypothetical protein RI054_06g35130 [Pseudoscourfieldia marina]
MPGTSTFTDWVPTFERVLGELERLGVNLSNESRITKLQRAATQYWSQKISVMRLIYPQFETLVNQLMKTEQQETLARRSSRVPVRAPPPAKPFYYRRPVLMTRGLPLNEPLLDETCEPCDTPAVLKTQIADLEATIYATQLAEWNGECFACGKKGHRQYQKDADGKYVCEKTAELARQGKLPAPRRPGSTQTRTKRVMWVDDTTGDCYDTERDEEHADMSVPDASAATMTGHSTDDGTPSGGGTLVGHEVNLASQIRQGQR